MVEKKVSFYAPVRKIREKFNKWFYAPIYYSYWSRDCDMCETEGVRVFYGGRKAFLQMWDEKMEWADGPFGYDEITKEEYDELKHIPASHRDRCMEAYENGNGRSIYV